MRAFGPRTTPAHRSGTDARRQGREAVGTGHPECLPSRALATLVLCVSRVKLPIGRSAPVAAHARVPSPSLECYPAADYPSFNLAPRRLFEPCGCYLRQLHVAHTCRFQPSSTAPQTAPCEWKRQHEDSAYRWGRRQRQRQRQWESLRRELRRRVQSPAARGEAHRLDLDATIKFHSVDARA